MGTSYSKKSFAESAKVRKMLQERDHTFEKELATLRRDHKYLVWKLEGEKLEVGPQASLKSHRRECRSVDRETLYCTPLHCYHYYKQPILKEFVYQLTLQQ